MQGEITNLREQVKKLQEDFQTADKSIIDIQKELEMKANIKDLERLKEEFLRKTDLENRSKCNNFVFWNVPEGEESGTGCIRLLEDIIVNHMKLKDTEDVLIERVHRSGVKKSAKDSEEFSRPIPCRFLHWGDKEYVMKEAPCVLKNNPYGAKRATVIVTNDVSKKVREERKILKTHLPDLLNKPLVKVAFIPYTVPARIQYTEEDSWKFFFYLRNKFEFNFVWVNLSFNLSGYWDEEEGMIYQMILKFFFFSPLLRVMGWDFGLVNLIRN